MKVLGVMSGSSLDGLDLAIVNVSHDSFELEHAVTTPMPVDLAHRLADYAKLSVAEYILLERDYADFIGETINHLLSNVSGGVQLIGLHGHTIVHVPSDKITVQLGNGGQIASLTNTDVVTDFRIQDVAKGGEGTPLASLIDINLFKGYDSYLNLGGIANITNLVEGDLVAYDICPCNQLLNHLSTALYDLAYDDGGNIARNGIVRQELATAIDKFEYWALAPPKSLDNNWIKNNFLTQIDLAENSNDILATMVDWVATEVAKNIPARAIKILVTGGGAYNNYLLELIEKKIDGKLTIPSKNIIDYKESILMAYLAYLRVHEQHNVLKAVTKAKSDSIAGAYYKA